MNFNAQAFCLMPLKQNQTVLFLTVAFFLYGLWGSPTPNNPNWLEAIIALCLVVAIGFSGLVRSVYFEPHTKTEKWILFLKIFFLYGASVPLLIGVISGHDKIIISRDLVAFIFLCLPLFLFHTVNKTQKQQKIFFILCLMVGGLFAIRVLVPHFLLFRNTTELLYLANSPLVLMSALFLIGNAGHLIYRKITFTIFFQSIACLMLASMLIVSMFVDLQRASFAALIISCMSLFLIGFIKAPFKMIMPVLIICFLVVVSQDYGLDIMRGVGEKTARVGSNMRLQELEAIISDVAYDPVVIIWGQGWGAQFTSPAVGNLNVSYTHSLLSYIFFKMGLSGLFLCLVYLYFVFEKLLRLYFSDGVKGNALVWPLIIPIFLYASHKSFDFGVLLTLIFTMSPRVMNREGAYVS